MDCTDYNLILFANLDTYNLIVITAVTTLLPCNVRYLPYVLFLRIQKAWGTVRLTEQPIAPRRHRLWWLSCGPSSTNAWPLRQRPRRKRPRRRRRLRRAGGSESGKRRWFFGCFLSYSNIFCDAHLRSILQAILLSPCKFTFWLGGSHASCFDILLWVCFVINWPVDVANTIASWDREVPCWFDNPTVLKYLLPMHSESHKTSHMNWDVWNVWNAICMIIIDFMMVTEVQVGISRGNSERSLVTHESKWLFRHFWRLRLFHVGANSPWYAWCRCFC